MVSQGANAHLQPPAAAAPGGAGPSRTLRWFTVGSLLVAALALTVTVVRIGPRVLWAQLLGFGWGILAVLALEVLITACDAAALTTILAASGRRPRYASVVRAQITGRAVNAVTPLGSLGEVTKIAVLSERMAASRATAAVLRYNLIVLAVRLVVIALGAPICALALETPRWLFWLLLGGGSGAAVCVVVGVLAVKHGVLYSLVDGLRKVRLISRARWQAWRARLVVVEEQMRPRRVQTRMVRWIPAGLVALSRALSLVSAWAALAAAGVWVGPHVMAALASAGQLLGFAASMVPMGLGISEAGNAALFAALGQAPALGVALVLAGRVVTLCYAALGLGYAVSAASLRASVNAWRRRTPRHSA